MRACRKPHQIAKQNGDDLPLRPRRPGC